MFPRVAVLTAFAVLAIAQSAAAAAPAAAAGPSAVPLLVELAGGGVVLTLVLARRTLGRGVVAVRRRATALRPSARRAARPRRV